MKAFFDGTAESQAKTLWRRRKAREHLPHIGPLKEVLQIDVPEWALPHREPATYRGARGGRSSGKSHFMAEMLVEAMVNNPDMRVVCIREVQRTLRFSAKSLIESKIRQLGVSHLFDILTSEIRRVGGTGICIFEGMQDHTADSIKSLENFRLAWVEEAQRISKRSLELLIPTIRSPGSEMWFSWNPEQPDDPTEQFFADLETDGREPFTLTANDYRDNPHCPEKSVNDAERTRRVDPDGYAHIWLGGYNVKSEAQVLNGKWRIDEFEAGDEWDGPYYGVDWGFSQDPTVIVRLWIWDGRLWIDHEDGGVKWDNDHTARRFKKFPGAASHVLRADSARPDTINEIVKRGLDIRPADKWQGSVEDGVTFLRTFEEIVIHERCERTQTEARLWSYKTDRLTGDPLPKLVDANNHIWDAVRYALSPLIHEEGYELWVA